MFGRANYLITLSFILCATIVATSRATIYAQESSVCGWFETAPKPYLFVSGTQQVFSSITGQDIPYDRVMSLDLVSDVNFEHSQLIYTLESGYYRIYDPVIDNGSQNKDFILDFSRIEAVADCESVQPTLTATRIPPTPIQTSSANNILTAANVPWATQCPDTSSACLPYRLSVGELPVKWQPFAIMAATMWADAVPQLQFTQGPISESARTLVPTGLNDWMPAQAIGDLRLAVGEIRIVPESALSPHKLPQGIGALGIAYTNQSLPRQAIAGLIIVKEYPALNLYWGFDGNFGIGKLDLQTLLAHELGHVLGICDHDMDPACNSSAAAIPDAAIMHSFEKNLISLLWSGLVRRELHTADIQLMTTLYPPTDLGKVQLPAPGPTPITANTRVPVSSATLASPTEPTNNSVRVFSQTPTPASVATFTPTPTTTPQLITSLNGRWELRQAGGDCFGYLESDVLEFFADGFYTARTSSGNQPFGGRYTIVDTHRVRFEIPQGTHWS